jgi:acylglycerol lipase
MEKTENVHDENINISFLTSQGKINALFYPSAEKKNSVECKVLCLHGFCCDARIFQYLGRALSKSGIDTYAIDLFGHGKSDGKRGDPDFNNTLKGIDEILSQILSDNPQALNKKQSKHPSLYILAHSLGCTYAMWYLASYTRRISGLILLAPYVWIKEIKNKGEAVPATTTFYNLLLRRIFTPSNLISAKKIVSNSIMQTKEVEHMINDPDIINYYSYRYIVDVIGFRNTKINRLSSLRAPILILHGKKDTNVNPQISERFYTMLKSDKKSIKLLDCDHWFNHAIFFNQDDNRYSEVDRLPITNSIVDWIDAINSAN